MNNSKHKAARIFLFLMGIILIIAGIYILIIGRKILFDTLIHNLPFFLSGGILIYLGLTYKKSNQKNKPEPNK
jgi:hypothetical protein